MRWGVRKRTCGREMVSQAKRFLVLVSNCHRPKEQREQSQACLGYAESRLRKTKSMTGNLHEIFFYNFKKEILLGDCWILLMIADYKTIRYADMWSCSGFAGETFFV